MEAPEGTIMDEHGSLFCEVCGTLLSDKSFAETVIRDCPMGCKEGS